MKKIIVCGIAACIITASMGFSCKKAEPPADCISFAAAPVNSVQGPVTANINQEVILKVAVVNANGCGSFSKFTQEQNGNNFTVTTTVKYQGCICTQVLVVQDADYSFRASLPGVYRFSFTGTSNQQVVHTITVQ